MCKDELSIKKEAGISDIERKEDGGIPEYTIQNLLEAYEDDASRMMGYHALGYEK